MPIERIDHIYAETREWDASVAFWTVHSLEAR